MKLKYKWHEMVELCVVREATRLDMRRKLSRVPQQRRQLNAKSATAQASNHCTAIANGLPIAYCVMVTKF